MVCHEIALYFFLKTSFEGVFVSSVVCQFVCVYQQFHKILVEVS